MVIPTRGVGPLLTGAWPHIPNSSRSCGSSRKNVPPRWRRCPTQEQWSGSELHWWGRAAGVVSLALSCGGLVRDLVLFFLLRMILVPSGSVGSSWVVHSGSSGSVLYAFFALVWGVQGAMPATLTERSVLCCRSLLRRTMQIVKCSLLRWRAQGRVSS